LALTPKQQAFADYYLELGNATESAKRAGYSEQTAYSIGIENLKKPEISAYIEKRLKEINSKRIATIDEVMQFYTNVLRGEEKDQFGLDASLTDRLKAGQELIKRLSVGGNNPSEQKEDDPLTKALKEEAERMHNETD
jgi:phage terminase small subunit